MGTGGPTVTVHVDEAFTRDYRRALVRQRRRRWVGFGTAYVVFAALASSLQSGSMLLSLVIFVGVALYSEIDALRRDSDLPVGQELIAEYGDVSLVVRRPDRTLELPYAFHPKLRRIGPLMWLEDGAGQQIHLPSAVFTPEAEAWFRHRARPRDLEARPVLAGQVEFVVEDGLPHRLAMAAVTRYHVRELAPTVVVFGVIAAVGAILGEPGLAVFIGVVVVVAVLAVLVRRYDKLRDTLLFQYADRPVRVGPDGSGWVVDATNFRLRIDPDAVTTLDRRRGLAFVCHTTMGEQRRDVLPDAWVAGLAASSADSLTRR